MFKGNSTIPGPNEEQKTTGKFVINESITKSPGQN